jgi:hypothetical protein
MAACKAKVQNLRLMAPTKKVQAEVVQKSKRNLETCIKDVRAAAAKVERDEEREMIVQEVSAETRESLLHPRKRMKKELMDNSTN